MLIWQVEDILKEAGVSREELEEMIREALYSEGLCFPEDYDLEVVATSRDEFVDYCREYLEDVCGDCYRAGLTIDPESLADSMLGDTVYLAEVAVNGKSYEFYVRLA